MLVLAAAVACGCTPAEDTTGARGATAPGSPSTSGTRERPAFAPGEYYVGIDIPPGRYETVEIGGWCRVTVRVGFSEDPWVEAVSQGQLIVEIPDEQGAIVEIRGCVIGPMGSA